jgi:hypothetical protein
MDPCVRAGEERRVNEENPRSLIGGRLHANQRALLEALGKRLGGE